MATYISAHLLLGLVLIAYGLWGLWRPELRNAHTPTAAKGAIVGATTGFVTALTAVFVIPLVPYLQTLRLDKDTMVQALGLSFTVATIALAVRLHSVGGFHDAVVGICVCAGRSARRRVDRLGDPGPHEHGAVSACAVHCLHRTRRGEPSARLGPHRRRNPAATELTNPLRHAFEEIEGHVRDFAMHVGCG